MINRVRIENYKALRDVTLELTPIHALIGPNDSGKTSVLSALAALSRSTDHVLQQAFAGPWEGRELVWHGSEEGMIAFEAEANVGESPLTYRLSCRFSNNDRNVAVQEEKVAFVTKLDLESRNRDRTRVCRVTVDNEGATADIIENCRAVHQTLSGVQYYRWNPRMLALPVAPDSARRFRMNSDGFGLALFLDDILGYDRKRFGELEEAFCDIFPEIDSLKLSRQKAFRSRPDEQEHVSRLDQADGKGIYFQLRENQQLVPAGQASDGVLLVLAYLAVLYSPEPPALILIEEPENGIHPKRLREVMSILRKLIDRQDHTQIVLTTHSPYAVDLFSPDEVTLCTKNQDGAISLRRLSNSETVKEQLSLFTLGEIWTAEGDKVLANGPSSATP